MLPASEYMVPYLLANLIAAGLVVIAYVWPVSARTLYILLFIASGLFCLIVSNQRPEAFVEVFAEVVVLEIYRRFIYGFFAQNLAVMIKLIAAGQIVVGILLAAKGRFFSLGVLGGIAFFIVLIPLGPASAFPSTVLMAVGLFVMFIKTTRKTDQAGGVQ
jgi:hypothetical protein